MVRSTTTLGAILIAVAMVGTGCGDDDGMGDAGTGDTGTGDTGTGDTSTPVDTGTGDTGMDPMADVRVIHLSPDAPGVDVFVGDAAEATITNLEFPDSTAYLPVPAATYTFNVRVTGMPMMDPVLTFADMALTEGMMLTAVAWNEVAAIDGLAVTNTSDGLDAANFRVRAVHAAKDVGEVDIWNIPEMGEPTPVWPDLAQGAVGDEVDLPAGAYTLGVDADDDGTPDLIFELPEIPAGALVNAYAVSEDDSTIYLVAQLPDGTTARIDPTTP